MNKRFIHSNIVISFKTIEIEHATGKIYRSFKLREYFKIFNDDLCIEFQETYCLLVVQNIRKEKKRQINGSSLAYSNVMELDLYMRAHFVKTRLGKQFKINICKK